MRREPRFKAFIESCRPLEYDPFKLKETGRTMAKEKSNGRQHKATYAADKYTGGWNVRITGPNANRFANRIVPVTRKDDSEENEQLGKLIWTGTDELTGQPVALYKFEAKPKDVQQDELPF